MYNDTESVFFWEHPETPARVKEILSRLVHTDTRIRIFDGDPATGRDWCEEYMNKGTVGRSTGIQQIPLLIASSRSLGGPAILTHCIVKITRLSDNKILYCHPTYSCPTHEIRPSELPDYAEDVLREGEVVARFKVTGKARKWVDYIEGRRNNWS